MDYYKGAYGYTLQVDTGSDISTGTTFQLIAQSPSGAIKSLTGFLSGTQEIHYTVASGDFDESGEWKLQAKITYASAVSYGDPFYMTVKETVG